MEALKAKITSEEQLKAIVDSYTYHSAANAVAQETGLRNSEIRWWAVREKLRITKGVYEMTEALKTLNTHANVFAHISTEDPTMVAFTPDAVAGEADRQVRTTFGRLATKLLSVATENYVRHLTVEHEAELNNEVEFITGENIAVAYASEMGNVGACMSGKSFQSSGYVQPTIAYDMPTIKLAVLRNKDGAISERCMVYENGDDKRAIRYYPGGNSKLRKRLEKRGFMLDSWADVEFRAVELDVSVGEGLKAYAMPYLDCRGGTSGTDSTVAVVDGRILALGEARRKAVNALNIRGSTAIPGTSGYVALAPLSGEQFFVKDIVTGNSINTLLDNGYVECFHNGELGVSMVSEAFTGLARYCDSTTDNKLIWYNSENTETFTRFGEKFIDTEVVRIRLGYKKLSATYYPEQGWSDSHIPVYKDGEEHIIDKVDAVSLVEEDDSLTYVHKSVINKKDFVKLHKDGRYEGYVRKGTKFFLTPSGRKVHPSYNSGIEKLWDGSYDFSRNVKHRYVVYCSGTHVFAYRNADDKARMLASGIVEKTVTEGIESLYALYDNNVASVLSRVNVDAVSIPKEANLFYTPANWRYNTSLKSAVASYMAGRYGVTPTAKGLSILVEEWFSGVNTDNEAVIPVVNAVRRWSSIKFAEMLAEEAPAYLKAETPEPERAEARQLEMV